MADIKSNGSAAQIPVQAQKGPGNFGSKVEASAGKARQLLNDLDKAFSAGQLVIGASGAHSPIDLPPPSDGSTMSDDVRALFSELVSHLDAAGNAGSKFSDDGLVDETGDLVIAACVTVCTIVEIALAECHSGRNEALGHSHYVHGIARQLGVALQAGTCGTLTPPTRNRVFIGLLSSIEAAHVRRKTWLAGGALSPRCMSNLLVFLQRIERLRFLRFTLAGNKMDIQSMMAIQQLLSSLRRAEGQLIYRLR